ncbi:MAG: hypothetical protein P8Z31_05380 [Gammaproteobacteria bacterium]|jgi:hypothetical protein
MATETLFEAGSHAGMKTGGRKDAGRLMLADGEAPGICVVVCGRAVGPFQAAGWGSMKKTLMFCGITPSGSRRGQLSLRDSQKHCLPLAASQGK